MNVYCDECGWHATCNSCGGEGFTRLDDVYSRCIHRGCGLLMSDTDFQVQHAWWVNHQPQIDREQAEELRWESTHDR